MKLAFIGTGKIVADALYAVQPLENIERTAVYARPHSKEKAETLAQQYGIKEIWTDYDELLAGTAADTVYIGLVNSAHYPYAKQALLAGKNVILEKPFTGFLKEALELREIAIEQGLFIFEAVTVLHGGLVETMKEQLEKIGQPRMLLANYSQYSSRYDEYLAGETPHAFDQAYYGGALYDINIYNVHYTVSLFGMPLKTAYYPNTGRNGIDTSGTLVLTYNGFSAVLTGAKDSDSPGFVSVQGEKGWMRTEGKPNIADHLTVHYFTGNGDGKRDAAGSVIRDAVTEEYDLPEVFHRMTKEFSDFADIMARGDYETAERLLQETVQVLRVLEQARAQAGIEF